MLKRRRPQRGQAAPPQAPDANHAQATNPALRAQLLEIVEQQLSTGDPPETRATLERLVGMGYTREGARELIAVAVTSEIFDVMARGEPYDAARYKAALARLPEIAYGDA